jgi:hypothetical protein
MSCRAAAAGDAPRKLGGLDVPLLVLRNGLLAVAVAAAEDVGVVSY